MRTATLVVAVLSLAVGARSHAQPVKAKPGKKEADLPEVSFVIPEDTRPEVKALIMANVLGLKSKSASERTKAAKVLGELGEQGKPVRRLLCQAMLDPAGTVQTAAADALKNIDPKMHYLALAVTLEQARGKRLQLMHQIQKLEDDGEPLVPLVAKSALLSAAKGNYIALEVELTALSFIGKSDLGTCKLLASALTSFYPEVRYAAVEGLARMKYGPLEIGRVMVVLAKDVRPENRVAATRTLAALVNESNEEAVVEAISAQRFHSSEGVRKAVEEALNKIENRDR